MLDAVIRPVLNVRTERLENAGSLIEWCDPLQPVAFIRNGDGIVGFGSRIDFVDALPGRIGRVAEWWAETCATAIVEDHVNLPGTGLVAFGSFAFSDASTEPSFLSVPSIVIGRRGADSWITTVDSGMPVESGTPVDSGTSVAPRPLGPPPQEQLGPGSLRAFSPGSMSEDAYRAAVRTATEAIGAGRAEKVVVARELVARIPAMSDRRVILARLASAYPDTFAFAVNGLVGASPETLVRVTDGLVSARVLAGTAARGADATADAAARAAITSSSKDRAEHEFALASVVAALGPYTTDLNADSAPFAIALPNLFHLASDVSGSLAAGSTVLDLVGALHPTAAVAGTSTRAALKLIDELEPFDRGRYAGPVGWVDSHGDGEWAVALRCAQIDEDGWVTAWAGAGIVADSDPSAELAETELKFRPVREAFEL